jgi:hypothetical protein
MQCTICGTALDHTGQAHACRPVPPTGWVVTSTLHIGLATLFAITSVVYAVLRIELLGSGLDQWAALAFFAALLGLFAVYVLWQHSTRRLAYSYGGNGHEYARNWGFRRLYIMALVLILVVQWSAGVGVDRNAGADKSGAIIVIAVLRCIAALALMASVLYTWGRIKRLMVNGPDPQPLDRLVPAGAKVDWTAVPWDPDLEDFVDRRRNQSS